MKIHLIINYHVPASEERRLEYNHCVLTNHNSGLFNTITNLSDVNSHKLLLDAISSNPLTSILHKNTNYRPKFSDMVRYCNDQLYGQICIISNTDILFNQSINHVKFLNLDKCLLCVTRWEQDCHTWEQNCMRYFAGRWCIKQRNNMNYYAAQSQDVWVFKSPLRVPIYLLDFPMGTMGCDGKFGHIANMSGYQTFNPCMTIKCYHYHASKYRTYDESHRLDSWDYSSYPSHITHYN
jgi:hypothetical protein